MGVSYRVTFVATLILPSTKTTVAYRALEQLRCRLSPDVDDVRNSIMAPRTPFLPVLGDVIEVVNWNADGGKVSLCNILPPLPGAMRWALSWQGAIHKLQRNAISHPGN